MKINGHFVTAPTLSELLSLHADDIGSKLRVCMTGEVVTYNPLTRTASVLLGESFVLNDGTVLPVPAPLLDVPVVTLQGGILHVGMPIQPGDECLLVFCDFNIGSWFTSGGQQVPPDRRQHDISDAFAIVGLNSLASALPTSLTDSEGGLASPTAKIAINEITDLVTIANAEASLLQVLQNLITAVTATNGAPGANVLTQLIVIVSTLASALALTTTASVAAGPAGLPQIAAATAVTQLTALAATVTAQSAAATTDAAAAQAFAEALFY